MLRSETDIGAIAFGNGKDFLLKINGALNLNEHLRLWRISGYLYLTQDARPYPEILKPYITVHKTAIPNGKLNYTELLKSLSNEFKDSEKALVFSPFPGKLIDVVNHLTENQISFNLTFSPEEDIHL